MSKFTGRLLIALTLTPFGLSVATIACLAQSTLEHQSEALKLTPGKPLQGGIQHIHTMPQLDPRLRVGAVFSDEMLKDLQPINDWFRIPAWFAGGWSTTSKRVVEFHDFKSGFTDRPNKTISNRWRGSRGMQRDRHGDIWEYKDVPSVERVETPGRVDYKLIKDYEPLEVSENLVSRRKVVMSISVDKSSQKIKEITQQDIIQTSKPIGHGAIRTVSSSKVFNANGAPVCLQEDESQSRKIFEFAPRDTVNSQDMRKLFKDYLNSNNMSDLVPPELIGGSPELTGH